MSTPSRPPLRWHGGKWRLAPRILAEMPPHEVYTEAFGGGASVLLRKGRSRLEVYNDLDGAAVEFFRVLRSQADALAAAVAATPFARAEHLGAYEAAADPVERARRFLVRSHMGFGSNGVHRSTGFRSAGIRAGTLPCHLWAGLPEVVRSAAARMQGVVIERKPALAVLSEHDGPEAMHYVDPPYMAATRSDARPDYAVEMSDGEHAGLLDALCRLEGAVILSGYAAPLYDDRLAGWRRIEVAARADRSGERTEVLWLNFSAQPRLI